MGRNVVNYLMKLSPLPIASTALNKAVTGFTAKISLVRKVPVVCLTSVTLVSSHSWLTLALTINGTLEVSRSWGQNVYIKVWKWKKRTIWITVTSQTWLTSIGIFDGGDVMVWLTNLTMGSISVSSTLHALSSPPRLHVQLLIEPALGGPATALVG